MAGVRTRVGQEIQECLGQEIQEFAYGKNAWVKKFKDLLHGETPSPERQDSARVDSSNFQILTVGFLKLMSKKRKSRLWGFEFIHAYISRDKCWIYCGLTHTSMHSDMGIETLNTKLRELKV